jgi:phage-related protein
LTSVQSGAEPAAWIVGTLPPGTYYRFKFEKAGCVQKLGAVEWNGRSYDGHLPIEAKAVSSGILFVE